VEALRPRAAVGAGAFRRHAVVGASHGDIFYPTSFLRLILPVATVVNLNFVLHTILAGLFTYLLLRRFRVAWSGAVAGGLAYELTGLLASYPSPGHDGKLFAATALPLALLALVLALRERRWEGYGLLAFAVALALLGHFQMAYYVLIAAGLFRAVSDLRSGDPGRAARARRPAGPCARGRPSGIRPGDDPDLPFIQYIPFSPRAQGYHGFAGATSYAVPWEHVPGFFFRNFVGARDTYWGPNPIKLHSDTSASPSSRSPRSGRGPSSGGGSSSGSGDRTALSPRQHGRRQRRSIACGGPLCRW